MTSILSVNGLLFKACQKMGWGFSEKRGLLKFLCYHILHFNFILQIYLFSSLKSRTTVFILYYYILYYYIIIDSIIILL